MNRVMKGFIFSLCFVCWTAVLISQAWAITLSFNPSESIINVGYRVYIDIDISGMDSANLGAFDLDVSYDDTILAFYDYDLGSGLGDISGGEALDFSLGDLGGGVIDLAEVSLLWDLTSQPDAFTLATVSFDGISLGTSNLWLSDVTLGDDNGDPLNAAVEGGKIDVVPEPTTMLIFGTGLVGLAGFGRKKFKK
jgi:hypothetical protein